MRRCGGVVVTSFAQAFAEVHGDAVWRHHRRVKHARCGLREDTVTSMPRFVGFGLVWLSCAACGGAASSTVEMTPAAPSGASGAAALPPAAASTNTATAAPSQAVSAPQAPAAASGSAPATTPASTAPAV